MTAAQVQTITVLEVRIRTLEDALTAQKEVSSALAERGARLRAVLRREGWTHEDVDVAEYVAWGVR